MVEVFTALQTDVDAIWPHIAEGMKVSCETATFTPGYLWQECRSGAAFLIVAIEDAKIIGAGVVQFQDAGRTLRGLGLCGVRIDDWFPAMRAEGIRIMGHGGAERFLDTARPGMKRFYPDAKIVGVTYEVRP